MGTRRSFVALDVRARSVGMTVESADICERCLSRHEQPDWNVKAEPCGDRLRLLALLRARPSIGTFCVRRDGVIIREVNAFPARSCKPVLRGVLSTDAITLVLRDKAGIYESESVYARDVPAYAHDLPAPLVSISFPIRTALLEIESD